MEAQRGDTLKKFIVSTALGAVMIVSSVSGAYAQELGTPGEANCRGKTASAIAQLGKDADFAGVRGIGGIVRFFNDELGVPLTVKELQEDIRAFCAGEFN